MSEANEKTPGVGHNVQPDRLRSFVERVERLEEEIKDLNSDKSEIYKEAKNTGFDVKALKRVVSARRQDPEKRDAEDAVFSLYMDALDGFEASRVRAREEPSNDFASPISPNGDKNEAISGEEGDESAPRASKPLPTRELSVFEKITAGDPAPPPDELLDVPTFLRVGTEENDAIRAGGRGRGQQ